MRDEWCVRFNEFVLHTRGCVIRFINFPTPCIEALRINEGEFRIRGEELNETLSDVRRSVKILANVTRVFSFYFKKGYHIFTESYNRNHSLEKRSGIVYAALGEYGAYFHATLTLVRSKDHNLNLYPVILVFIILRSFLKRR